MVHDLNLQARLFSEAFPEFSSTQELSDEMCNLYGIDEIRFNTSDGEPVYGIWDKMSDYVRFIESYSRFHEDGLHMDVVGCPEDVVKFFLSKSRNNSECGREEEWGKAVREFRKEFNQAVMNVAKERNAFLRNRLGKNKIELLKRAFPNERSLHGLMDTMKNRLRENFSTDDFPTMSVVASFFKAPNGCLDLGGFENERLVLLGTWDEMLECGIGIDEIVLVNDETAMVVSLLADRESDELVSHEAFRNSFFDAVDVVWSEKHIQREEVEDVSEVDTDFELKAQALLFRKAFPEFDSPRDLIDKIKRWYNIEILFNTCDGVSEVGDEWESFPEIERIEAYWKDEDLDKWEVMAYPMEFVSNLKEEYSGKIENIQEDEWNHMGYGLRSDFYQVIHSICAESEARAYEDRVPM